MRVAISTDNNMVSAHFGRCQNYTIVDFKENIEIRRHTINTPPHEPGLLPKILKKNEVDLVITGGIGRKAQAIFNNMSIQTMVGVKGKIDDVIQDFLKKELQEGQSLCTHDSNHTQRNKK